MPLGCATEDVRKWGPGLSQSIDGGELGPGAILALDRFGEAFVFSGELWESFRWLSDGASTDVAGYPVTPPLLCDGSYVVALAGGSDGPGALVQHADGHAYEQVSGDVWFVYEMSGGPGGPLGRPLTVTSDGSGHHADFEGGSISAPLRWDPDRRVQWDDRFPAEPGYLQRGSLVRGSRHLGGCR